MDAYAYPYSHLHGNADIHTDADTYTYTYTYTYTDAYPDPNRYVDCDASAYGHAYLDAGAPSDRHSDTQAGSAIHPATGAALRSRYRRRGHPRPKHPDRCGERHPTAHHAHNHPHSDGDFGHWRLCVPGLPEALTGPIEAAGPRLGPSNMRRSDGPANSPMGTLATC